MACIEGNGLMCMFPSGGQSAGRDRPLHGSSGFRWRKPRSDDAALGAPEPDVLSAAPGQPSYLWGVSSCDLTECLKSLPRMFS